MSVHIVEFRNDFPKIAAHMWEGCAQACYETARKIADEANVRCPRDTGALASTCRAEPAPEFGRTAAAALAGDADRMMTPPGSTRSVPITYGIYQEFGTRFMAAQPFFFPAVEAVRPDFPAIVSEHLFTNLQPGSSAMAFGALGAAA